MQLAANTVSKGFSEAPYLKGWSFLSSIFPKPLTTANEKITKPPSSPNLPKNKEPEHIGNVPLKQSIAPVSIDEDTVEQSIRTAMGSIIMECIHISNSSNNNFNIVIAGGRGIELYLTEYLQNVLSSKEIYEKSFDYDLYVYPKREADRFDVMFHPYYYGSQKRGYIYNYKTRLYEKKGTSPVDPLEWTPYRNFINILNNHLNELGHSYRIDSIINSLRPLDPTGRIINFKKLEYDIVQRQAISGRFVTLHGNKGLWQLYFNIPTHDNINFRIQIIDLKNPIRNVENRGGEIFFEGKLIESRKYQNVLGKVDFGSVTRYVFDRVHPTNARLEIKKNLIVLHPFLLLQDNGPLVGNSKAGRQILGKEYDDIIKKIRGIINAEVTLQYEMDREEFDAATKNLKYKNKYKKRLVRVAFMYYMCMFMNRFPNPMWKQNIEPGDFIRFFNLHLIHDQINNRLVLEDYYIRFPLYFAGETRYKYGYDLFDKKSIKYLFASPGFESGATITNKRLSKMLVDWDKYNELFQVGQRNLDNYLVKKTVVGLLESDETTYKLGDLPFSKTCLKWSASELKMPEFPNFVSLTHGLHPRVKELLALSGNDRKKFFNSIYEDRKGNVYSKWANSAIYFSYNYPPGLFKKDEFFECYRIGPPFSAMFQTTKSMQLGFIDNFPNGSIIFPAAFLATTMLPVQNFKGNLLSLSTIKESIRVGHNLYIIRAKNKGFLFVNRASRFKDEAEIVFHPFSKMRIVKKRWEYIAMYNDVREQESVFNYRKIYVIELELIEETYDEVRSTVANLPVVPKPVAFHGSLPDVSHKPKPGFLSGSLPVALHKSVASPPSAYNQFITEANKYKLPINYGGIDSYLKTIIDNAKIPTDVENVPIGIQQIANLAARDNILKFPPVLMNLWQLNTIGDGTCLIHAFLISTSPTYRQVNGEMKGIIGRYFRKKLYDELLESDPTLESNKTVKILNTNNYLTDEHIDFLMKRFDINILTITTRMQEDKVVPVHLDVIKDLETEKTDKPFIFIHSDGQNHYSSVRDYENKFITTWEEGYNFYSKYNSDELIKAIGERDKAQGQALAQAQAQAQALAQAQAQAQALAKSQPLVTVVSKSPFADIPNKDKTPWPNFFEPFISELSRHLKQNIEQLSTNNVFENFILVQLKAELKATHTVYFNDKYNVDFENHIIENWNLEPENPPIEFYMRGFLSKIKPLITDINIINKVFNNNTNKDVYKYPYNELIPKDVGLTALFRPDLRPEMLKALYMCCHFIINIIQIIIKKNSNKPRLLPETVKELIAEQAKLTDIYFNPYINYNVEEFKEHLIAYHEFATSMNGGKRFTRRAKRKQ